MPNRTSVPKYPGVFVRALKGSDRCFDYCYQDNGRKRWVTIGRESEGVTAATAWQARLKKLSEAKATRSGLKVNELLDKYLTKFVNPIRIAKDKGRIEKYLRPRFGELTIDQITRAKVEELKTSLITRRSTTQNSIYIIMRQIIQDSGYEGPNLFLRANGFKFTVVPANKSERFLTPNEARALLDQLGQVSPTWRDMAFLSLHTGVRLTELYRMTRHDLRPDGATAFITSKFGDKETLYLTPEASEIIKARSNADELLFPNARATRLAFRRSVKALGLNKNITDKSRRVWFHTLRHTFASWLAQSGVDLYTIQKLLRHKSISMTQRYAHLCPSNLFDGLKTLQRLLER
jgi:integrase